MQFSDFVYQLTAYIENCIDYVQKIKDLPFATDYFKELFSFYSKTASKDEKFEVATQANELLKNANDISLDNKLIIDVWGYVLHYLLKFDIMRYKDFEETFMVNRITKLPEDERTMVFDVRKKEE